MGYLKMVFDKYYETDDEELRSKLRKGFSTRLWNSLPYKKLNRSFRFKIVDSKMENEEVKKLFEPYKIMNYKILKSRYNLDMVQKEDLVRARINSNYGKYCDKEVYLGKDYYKHLAHIKNIYFNYVNGKYETIEEVEVAVNETYEKAMELKEEALSRKIDMSWKEYQNFVDKCLERIFENYIPLEENPNIEWEENDYLDWDEDNAILVYINVSLNGYLKNYINNSRKPKEKFCEVCGTEINAKSKNKYCIDCRKKVDKEKAKERMRKKRELLKKNKENNQSK